MTSPIPSPIPRRNVGSRLELTRNDRLSDACRLLKDVWPFHVREAVYRASPITLSSGYCWLCWWRGFAKAGQRPSMMAVMTENTVVRSSNAQCGHPG